MLKKIFAALAIFAAAAVWGAYRGHKLEMSNPDGYYKVGETAVCRVTLCKDGVPLNGTRARVIIYWEGKPQTRRDFVTTGEPVEVSFKSDKPGWVYFRFMVTENGKTLKGKGVYKHPAKQSTTAEAGAIFSADEIKSGIKRPADFEAFWKARRAKLDKVPLKPKYKRLPDPAPGIKLFTVEIPCAGDYPVSGYLAIPKGAKPKSLPAYVDWASWMASDTRANFAINRAKLGAIGFTPTWHGRP